MDKNKDIHLLIMDHLVGNVELQRVDKARGAFYEVASNIINTENDLLKVMD